MCERHAVEHNPGPFQKSIGHFLHVSSWRSVYILIWPACVYYHLVLSSRHYNGTKYRELRSRLIFLRQVGYPE